MGCSTCDYSTPIVQDTPYSVALKMAQTEAAAENKIYVVVEAEDGTFYHDCLECRIKNNITDGNIIAYVR